LFDGVKLLYHLRVATLDRSRIPKYQQLYETLQADIASGRLRSGDRLPSEAQLVRTFGASRITVGRAMRDLQREGLVDRRPGSGTFVRPRLTPVPATATGLTFGLIAPDLEQAEVLDAICRALTATPTGGRHAVLWGTTTFDGARAEAEAWALCQQHLERQVTGAFFAPLEHTSSKDAVNRRIARAFDDAGVPLVLLDRSVEPYGRYESHDVVGIDNRRAGFRITSHLVERGAQRISFVAHADAAASVDARLAGYREALHVHGALVHPQLVLSVRADLASEVVAFVGRVHPDAIVCANDRTAAGVMHALIGAGIRVPADVRLAGIDDVPYAAMLPVPLTTMRQPCREIGAAAMAAMLDRVSRPDLPPRDIFLHPTLVVRKSCGGASTAAGTE
jgi:DNA-binding LacI/PurR family transcriptional regulator